MLKLSIIIPVYNVERYIEQCLQSVLNQSYTHYEVICVNDGSNDNSLGILNRYKAQYSQIKVINQHNQGLSVARNNGLRKATGDYILFLDSDDWLTENALTILSQSITDQDFIAFNGKRFIEDADCQEDIDTGIDEKELTGWEYYNQYALQARKFHFVCVVLRAYKRSFLLKNNLHFEPKLYHEDNLFTPLVCYYAQKVRVIPNVLYTYRIRKESITTNKSIKNFEDIIKVANQLSNFFIPKTDIDKSIIYREIAGEYFSFFTSQRTPIHTKNNRKRLRKLINWDSFQQVSTYPRHKRIYRLLKISPFLFRLYLWIENQTKRGFQ